jgi:mRNA-degrading endonuclease toxin of MazEF toxin-antitoxin module
MMLRRGDVVTVLFPFSSGTGAKHRPALVVQCDTNNCRMANVIVAAITTTKHRNGQSTQLLVEVTSPVGQQSGPRT